MTVPYGKLETSNLARRRTAVSSTEKMQYLVECGHTRVTLPTLGILRPHNISGKVEDKNFKMQNAIKRGHVVSRDPLLEFWDPLISYKRFPLVTSNFARRRMTVSSNEKIQNYVEGHMRVT